MAFTLAQRAHKMNPSVIREILKVTERPGIISFAGGLPSADTFPIEAMQAACSRVLGQDGKAALQYAASEGYGPLRDWVAQELTQQGMRVGADQVLITTGSQQGLDLVAKVLIDAGSRVSELTTVGAGPGPYGVWGALGTRASGDTIGDAL
jgi:2-aminoadipate transaminase